MSDLFERRESGAEFSPCGRYRTRLWRRWPAPGQLTRSIAFLMLNPSKANDVENDPTVARCEERARRLGYTELRVVNLFALVSTDPAELKRVAEPIGIADGNDKAIASAFFDSDMFVLGWGKHGDLGYRGRLVALWLALRGGMLPVFCLGQNGDGSPEHPLYIGYDRPLVEFDADRYMGGFAWRGRFPVPDLTKDTIRESLGATGDLAVAFWDLQRRPTRRRVVR